MLKNKFSKKQLLEAGIIVVLLLLVIDVYSTIEFNLVLYIGLIVINLIIPVFFYPFAWFWFNLSEFIGSFSSKILLSLIFILFVIPVGIIRKYFVNDNLLLNQFKKDKSSVMKIRNYSYQANDLEKPY